MKKVSTVALVFFLGFFIFTPHPSSVKAALFDPEQTSSILFELANIERVRAGLPALKFNVILSQAAYAKAADMLAQEYFSHTSPRGKVFYEWVDNTGYEYSAVGENLALNLNTPNLYKMIESWLNSPGHRENLLSSTYTEAGLGVATGTYLGQDAIFAVHIFAKPKRQENLISEKRTSAQGIPLAFGVATHTTVESIKNTIVKKASASTPETSAVSASEITSFSSTDNSTILPSTALMSEKTHQEKKNLIGKILNFLLSHLSK